MYYDDEARRFNFLSGLTFGAVLGAGLALLLAPQKEVRNTAPLARTARAARRRAGSGLEQLREGVQEVVEAGRSRLPWRGR